MTIKPELKSSQFVIEQSWNIRSNTIKLLCDDFDKYTRDLENWGRREERERWIRLIHDKLRIQEARKRRIDSYIRFLRENKSSKNGLLKHYHRKVIEINYYIKRLKELGEAKP